MESSMELGKHVEDRVDKISNFPDELLGLVLSFLPTMYAVRTSILSRRWRYLFTLTDCLSFDDAPCFTYPGKSKETFQKFVYKVLELHQMSAIRKFSLVCQGTYNISHLNAWVEHAIQKGVQELNYQADEYGLPDALVTCKTIVKLRVKGYGHDIKFPPSSWWPSLKIVHLNKVRFGDYHSIERFLSSCEFIEELTLDYCELCTKGHVTISLGLLKVLRINHCYVKNSGFFEIKAPNLAYLTYDSNIGVKIVPLWKNSCSLVMADLCFNCESGDRSLTDERDILRAAAYKTTTLRLLSDSTVQCLLMMDDMGQMPDFYILSKLHLACFRCDSWKYVTNLLDKSPQLETVIFEEGLLYSSRHPLSPPSESLLPFSCHAKVIEVHNFCVHEGSLLLLRHLLRNARFLKNLTIIRQRRCLNDVKKVLQINDLTNLPRASSNCCIELK